MHPSLNAIISLMEEVMDEGDVAPMKRAQIMVELGRALGAHEVKVEMIVTMIDHTTDAHTTVLTVDIDPAEYL